jgi:hypothetical protein
MLCKTRENSYQIRGLQIYRQQVALWINFDTYFHLNISVYMGDYGNKQALIIIPSTMIDSTLDFQQINSIFTMFLAVGKI